jgi:hypothetical protein
MRGLRDVAALVGLGLITATSGLPAQSSTGTPTAPRDFWRAAAGIAATNALVWGFDRFVKGAATARVGTRSWLRNLGHGFEWDDDRFPTNQFAHPYHGSVYFGLARGSGYGFWASVPFTATGSLLWEYFGENNPPSLNDVVNTTLGGIALGEITYRLAARLRTGGASAKPGLGRTLAAAMISPGGVVPGDILDAGDMAESYRQQVANGYGWGLGPESGGLAHPFISLRVQGGTPFDSSFSRPFDALDFEFEVAGGEAAIVTRAQVNGLLGRHLLHAGDRTQAALAAYQHYDYLNTALYEWGGQSLSGGVPLRQRLWSRVRLDLGLHLHAVLLGALSSEEAGVVGRTYDYGPGLGPSLTASLSWGNREVLSLDGGTTWLHSVNGADADHLATRTRVRIQVPALRFLDVGGEVTRFLRDSRFALLRPVHQHVSQFRLYLVVPAG